MATKRWRLSFTPEAGRYGTSLPSKQSLIVTFDESQGWMAASMRLGHFPEATEGQVLRWIKNQLAENFRIPRRYVRIRRILRKK